VTEAKGDFGRRRVRAARHRNRPDRQDREIEGDPPVEVLGRHADAVAFANAEADQPRREVVDRSEKLVERRFRRGAARVADERRHAAAGAIAAKKPFDDAADVGRSVVVSIGSRAVIHAFR
jgi:hypothetical protein